MEGILGLWAVEEGWRRDFFCGCWAVGLVGFGLGEQVSGFENFGPYVCLLGRLLRLGYRQVS